MLRCSESVGIERRRKRQAGLTLVELIVAFTILLILTNMAVPMARYQVRRQRERALRADLEEMRHAIDRYKDLCDQGKIQSQNQDAYCYPTTLESLVEGVQMNNTLAGNGQSTKMRFLRRVPKDPMTGEANWEVVQEDVLMTMEQQDPGISDVHSASSGTSTEGTAYSSW